MASLVLVLIDSQNWLAYIRMFSTIRHPLLAGIVMYIIRIKTLTVSEMIFSKSLCEYNLFLILVQALSIWMKPYIYSWGRVLLPFSNPVILKIKLSKGWRDLSIILLLKGNWNIIKHSHDSHGFNICDRNPNCELDSYLNNVDWTPLQFDKSNYLDIGNDLVMKDGLNTDRYAFWDKLFPLNNTRNNWMAQHFVIKNAVRIVIILQHSGLSSINKLTPSIIAEVEKDYRIIRVK